MLGQGNALPLSFPDERTFKFSESAHSGQHEAMGEARFSFDVWGSRVEVKGLPEGIVLHRGTRPSLADIAELDRLRRTK